MPTLHDPSVRRALEARLETIRADSPRKWGQMNAGQMLWHVNQFMAAAIGEGTLPLQKGPMPASLLKFFVIYVPWPKSAPTNKGAIPDCDYDVTAEKARCKDLIAKFVSRPIEGAWPDDPSFGPVDGKFASKLQAKHLDHHFKQFGA